jgi:hypothetical protein
MRSIVGCSLHVDRLAEGSWKGDKRNASNILFVKLYV